MRRSAVVAVTGGAAALLVATAIAGAAFAPGPSAVAPTPTASQTPHPLFAGGYQDPAEDSASGPLSTAAPTRVRIPSLGVDTGVVPLGIDGAGVLIPPGGYDEAGWFAGGVVPGSIGPAIIAGHVDSATGPAVFYRIADLVPGEEVAVDLSDGTTATFAVTGTMQSAKAEFPTSAVYSTVPRAELRLITCAGAFDRSIGHYTDNLIVFAALRP